MPLISILRRQKQTYLCKFKASLVSRARFRIGDQQPKVTSLRPGQISENLSQNTVMKAQGWIWKPVVAIFLVMPERLGQASVPLTRIIHDPKQNEPESC
uniref:Uncharacterized protein n=1 Tax=Mus spicilegus TaxID=10103 RepID=A0A8C6GIQ0_MUSSI